MILELIIGILTLVAEWMIFKKMGRQGWEGIVPFYNTYVLCQELYGQGLQSGRRLRYRPSAAALHFPADPGLRR